MRESPVGRVILSDPAHWGGMDELIHDLRGDFGIDPTTDIHAITLYGRLNANVCGKQSCDPGTQGQVSVDAARPRVINARLDSGAEAVGNGESGGVLAGPAENTASTNPAEGGASAGAMDPAHATAPGAHSGAHGGPGGHGALRALPTGIAILSVNASADELPKLFQQEHFDGAIVSTQGTMTRYSWLMDGKRWFMSMLPDGDARTLVISASESELSAALDVIGGRRPSLTSTQDMTIGGCGRPWPMSATPSSGAMVFGVATPRLWDGGERSCGAETFRGAQGVLAEVAEVKDMVGEAWLKLDATVRTCDDEHATVWKNILGWAGQGIRTHIDELTASERTPLTADAVTCKLDEATGKVATLSVRVESSVIKRVLTTIGSENSRGKAEDAERGKGVK